MKNILFFTLTYFFIFKIMSKGTKSNMKHKAIRELIEIFELYPNVNISAHLITLLRPANKAFNWSDEELVKQIIEYKKELETDE